MKRLIPFIALAFLIGCATSGVVYKTLASVEATTTAAYSSYLTLVVTGKITTNSLPTVSHDYNFFQSIMQATVSVAALGTNSPVTTPVTDAAARVISDISMAKGGTP